MGKTKKFIDKKNSVTFYLAHRSQKDPLIVDETAPQHVLVPVNQGGDNGVTGSGVNNENNDGKNKNQKEQQLEYGIYFDDDYDYIQHIKSSEEVSNIEWDFKERIYAPALTTDYKAEIPSSSKDVKLKLPSSVFASEYEEKIGLLNKCVESRGPRPDLDPDVLAALDDDFDFEDTENQLEDNFIELATSDKIEMKDKCMTGSASEDEIFENDDDDYDYHNEIEERDQLGKLRFDMSSENGELNTRFTNYSMSSSVVRRNQQLTLLDDRFEKMFENYDDGEIGSLDFDEIEGHMRQDSDLLLKCVEKFEEEQQGESLNEKIEKLVLKQEDGELSHESDTYSEDSGDEDLKEKWDCQSIISTYSTTRNRPKLIKEPSRNVIKVGGKNSIPVGVLGGSLTKERLKEFETEYELRHTSDEPTAKSMISTISAMRNKTETAEERRKRKKLLREYRQERRAERKANTEAFKDEKKRQVKIRLNDVANVQGLKT